MPTSEGYVGSYKEFCKLFLGQEHAQSCPALCDPGNCSPPGSFVHGIFQVSILEWDAMPFSNGASRPDQTWVSCIACKFFIVWVTKWSTLKKLINTPTYLLFPCQSQMNCIQWWLWVPSLLPASGDLLLKMGNAPKRLLKSREQTLTNANLLLAFLGLTSFFPFAFPHSYRPKEPPLPFLPACNSVLIVDTTAILNYVTLDWYSALRMGLSQVAQW